LHYGCHCNTYQVGHVLTESVRLENRGKALALQAYARQAKDPEMEVMAFEIRIVAERRAGELLLKERGERASFDDGRPQKASNNTRLSDLGIDYDQSS
jgi:hypothetical protein